MKKEVSDKLYEMFESLKGEIYTEHTLSKASNSPTEEAYLRENLKTLRDRTSKIRNHASEIAESEKRDKQAQMKFLIALAITVVFVMLGLSLQETSPTVIGFIMGLTLVVEVAIVLAFLLRERPFAFLHSRNDRSLFRLTREVEYDARLEFRRSITKKLAEADTLSVSDL